MSELDIDGFLGHKTSSGGSSMLGRWKDSDSKSVDVWHHTRSPIAVSVWQHRIPNVDNVKDWQTKEEVNRMVGSTLVCWEAENVLKAQYKVDDDSGIRASPPEHCPICRFIDYIRFQVFSGKLDWLEPIFKLQGENDEKMTIVRAAHIYNGFSGDADKFTDDENKQMQKAKVFRKEAWKLNYFAKANYIFRVADNAHPEKGVQVTIEPALLGDKVKGVIAEMREKFGVDDGNPLKKPYCIRWKHLPEEKEFGKKYKAIAMDNIAITPDIKRLITQTNAPDVSVFTRRFNALTWKAKFQEMCLVDAPWDEIFGDDAYGGVEQPGTDFDPAKLAKSNGKNHEVIDTEGEEVIEDDIVACDECGKDMKVSESKCPHCGHVYEVESKEPAPPPPPARRTRSEATKAAGEPAKGPAPKAKGASAPAPAKAATAPVKAKAPPPPPAGAFDSTDDDLPF